LSKVILAETSYLKDLSAKDLEIIQARYDSMPLAQIAEKYGFKDNVCVANLFTPTGRLRQAYDEYTGILHQAFLDEVLNLQKKAIAPAMKVLIKNLSSSNGNISSGAARYLLDRELGSPKQAVEHSGEMPLQIIIKAPEQPKERVIDVESN